MTTLPILSLHGFLLFTAGELLFSLTPGPTVIMISAYGFRDGFRRALAAVAGTQAGNTLWYVLCIAGLGALVESAPTAFRIIRYLGAAYLVWLGILSLRASWQPAKAEQPRGPRLRDNPFVQGFLTQLGNPKAMLFFGAFLPQFIDTQAPLGPQYLVLYVVTMLGESMALIGYGWLAAHGGKAMPHHAIWRARISGLVLIALGIFAFASAA